MTNWRESALCAQVDTSLFYPDRGCSGADAKRICQACEARSECLEYALAHDERFGIWGGLSERERRKLKRGNAKNGKTARADKARRLIAEGHSDAEVAELTGLARDTVRQHRKRLERSQAAGATAAAALLAPSASVGVSTGSSGVSMPLGRLGPSEGDLGVAS